MARFVAVACLLAGCAQGSSDAVTTDAASPDMRPLLVDAAPPDACMPAATESCNNKDDDCDSMVDEGLDLGMPCDGVDNDACNEGMIVCNASGGTGCFDPSGDTLEICNGMDDDCQAGPDDTFDVGTSCVAGVGACATTGMKVCDGTAGTKCNAVPGTATRELCGNVIDEDCNGADPTCPVNDLPAGATDISAGGTFTVDLGAAHDDNFAVSTPTMDCGNMGGRDVFYQFTLGAEEVVYYDTFGSNFDTVVRLFAGACTAITTTQACSDDECSTTRSQGAIDLMPGTYCLVVDQFSSNTTAGMASLTFRRGARPGTPLSPLVGTVTGTTTGKTNLSIASCESNTTQPDVGHYFLTCPRSYTVSANTCTNTAFDTILYLRTGSAATADVSCSDDVTGCGPSNFQSRITGATVTGPNLHWLIVDGFGQTGNGSYSLSYSVQ